MDETVFDKFLGLFVRIVFGLHLSLVVDFNSIDDVKCLPFAKTLLAKSLHMFSMGLRSEKLVGYFKVSVLLTRN